MVIEEQFRISVAHVALEPPLSCYAHATDLSFAPLEH
jgi:hypothetical protein